MSDDYILTPEYQREPSECDHPRLPTPHFDEEAARDMEAHEIRKRWPRTWGTCPDCGAGMILYASFAHYIYGDY